MFEKITNFIITGEDKQDAIKEYENYIKNNKISECKIPQILYMSEIENKRKDSRLISFYKEQVVNKKESDVEEIQKNPSFINKILSLFRSNKKSSVMNIRQELIKVAKDLQAGALTLWQVANYNFYNVDNIINFAKTPMGEKFINGGGTISSFHVNNFIDAYEKWNSHHKDERALEIRKLHPLKEYAEDYMVKSLKQ